MKKAIYLELELDKYTEIKMAALLKNVSLKQLVLDALDKELQPKKLGGK